MNFLLSGLLLLAGLTGAQAQDYPTRPIHLIVPFSTGGGTDSSARVVAEKLSKQLGQQVVVENRPGASGNIGTGAVARMPADGYTLLLGFDGTLVINPFVYPAIPFDTLRDFTPVTKLGDVALAVVAHPSLQVRNLAQLLAYSKANPGKLSYGHSGVGGTSHVGGELLKQRTGLDMTQIPYKSGGQAVTDAVGGQVPLAYVSVAGAQGHLRSGRLVGIGVSTAKRLDSLPDLPTFIEQGVSDFEVSSWNGILVPTNTPRAVVDKLHREIVVALRDPDTRERFASLGIEPVGNTPEQFAAQIKADLARWAKVVEQAKIRLE
jgi:tripartite-type tricarboxylate transporter receptor subunit TctC